MENNEILDKIVKEISKEDWYVDYEKLCDKLNIPKEKRKYALSKLSEDGIIEISSTKDSLDIRLTDYGIVFVNESSYLAENENTHNISVISGNNNAVFQGINKSNIKVNSENQEENTATEYRISNKTFIVIIIAVLTLIATVIIGWDEILKFFSR